VGVTPVADVGVAVAGVVGFGVGFGVGVAVGVLVGVGVGVGVSVGVGVGVSVGVGVGVSVGLPVLEGATLVVFVTWRALAAKELAFTRAREMSKRERLSAATMSCAKGRALWLPSSFVLLSMRYKLPRRGCVCGGVSPRRVFFHKCSYFMRELARRRNCVHTTPCD
jgi:hypothetical protein